MNTLSTLRAQQASSAGDEKGVSVIGDRDTSNISEMAAMAAQAEAEADEAEALAAAAVRARARAIQLRQQAELVDDAAHTEVSTQATAKASPQGQERARDIRNRARKISSYLRRRRTRRVLFACLAGLVVVTFLVASGYEGWEHREASQRRQRAAEFAAAARQGIVTLTSLDFDHAKEDVRRVIDDSTGTFKDDFQKTADDFIKVVEQSKVVARGSVAATAVDLSSMTNDSAAVLVVSTSEITNAAGAKQEPRRFRLIVTMNRDGDQLKMSKVEFVP